MPSSDNEINDLNSEFQEAKEEYLDDIRQSSRENDLLQSLLSTVRIYRIHRLSVIQIRSSLSYGETRTTTRLKKSKTSASITVTRKDGYCQDRRLSM